MNSLYVFANEAIWAGDPSAVGNLKAMITDPSTAIEFKGKDIITVRNYKRLIVASNEKWPVKMDWDDRRFLILQVSAKRDKEYFTAIHDQLDNGGREALLYHLQNIDLRDFDPSLKPKSNAGFDIKLRSADPVQKWWYNCLRDAQMVLDQHQGVLERESLHMDKTTEVSRSWVYKSYTQYCGQQNLRYIEEPASFSKSLRLMVPSMGAKRPSQKTIGGKAVGPRQPARPWVHVFPPLDDCRREFAEYAKEDIDWADVN